MTQARANASAGMGPARKQRGPGCLGGLVFLLILLIVIIGGGFLFFVRPYAQAQLDQAMSDAVDQIPGAVALLPAGPITIDNGYLTNMIANNLPSDGSVKNPQAVITPQGIQIQLEILGQPCSMQGLPQLVHGQLKATNVQVSGLVGLFISPDQATSMIDRHIAEAQARLKHPIQNLQLQKGKMTIVLGSPSLV